MMIWCVFGSGISIEDTPRTSESRVDGVICRSRLSFRRGLFGSFDRSVALSTRLSLCIGSRIDALIVRNGDERGWDEERFMTHTGIFDVCSGVIAVDSRGALVITVSIESVYSTENDEN